MFRKLLIAAVPVLGLALPLVGATSAEAHEPYHAPRHDFHAPVSYYHAPVRYYPAPRYCVHVYYPVNCNVPWVCAGEYGTPYAAQCAAGGFQASGYEVRIDG